MTRLRWSRSLVAILGVALHERITFDPRPIDVAIIGASRAQLGLSAPRIAERLAAAGLPLAVANLSVIEDGRNIEWAIANELFKTKQPKLLVVSISERVNLWGHPGFKYVAPSDAIAMPPAPLLHNSLGDFAYLPYRQLMLFAASLAPSAFDLRDRFDAQRYAAKPIDYSQSRVLADGKRIDMDRSIPADALRAEARAFAATRHASRLPAVVAAVTDRDNSVYIAQIAHLAAQHGTRLIFVFLPEFDGATTIEGKAAYAELGRVEDYGDLAHDARWFQSFAHLNHRGAMVASDRVAAAIVAALEPGAVADDKAGSGMGEHRVTRPARNGAAVLTADR